jgi:hypothetical protein
MLRYWDDSPHTKGKKKQKNGQMLLFYLESRPDLKTFGFLTKIWV